MLISQTGISRMLLSDTVKSTFKDAAKKLTFLTQYHQVVLKLAIAGSLQVVRGDRDF